MFLSLICLKIDYQQKENDSIFDLIYCHEHTQRLISCASHDTCLITRTSGTCAASSEQAPQVRTFEHLGAPWGTLGHLRPASWAGATVRATAKHQQSAANGLPEKTCESGVLQDIS